MSDAYCQVNGVTAIRAHIVRPRLGPWVADIAIIANDPTPFEGAITIELPQAGLSFRGTAHRVGVHDTTTFLRAVGGAGGMATVIPGKNYYSPSVRILVNDILGAAGERLSPTTDAGILTQAFPFWTRPQQKASRALFSLLNAVGSPAWRVLPDGTVWIGPERWLAAENFRYILDTYEPNTGRLLLATATPTFTPGQTMPFDNEVRRISTVEHEIEGNRQRHAIIFEAVGEGDRLKAAFNSYAQDLAPRVDLFAGYWSTVTSQNADGSLELKPDDQRFGGWSRIPIRYGVPGIVATVPAGARCLVEFASGDPSKPMVTSWESGTILSLKIGPAAVDALVKGTTYRTAEDVVLNGLVTALNTIAAATTPSTAAAAAAFAALVTAFQAASASYLSVVAKTQ